MVKNEPTGLPAVLPWPLSPGLLISAGNSCEFHMGLSMGPFRLIVPSFSESMITVDLPESLWPVTTRREMEGRKAMEGAVDKG